MRSKTKYVTGLIITVIFMIVLFFILDYFDLLKNGLLFSIVGILIIAGGSYSGAKMGMKYYPNLWSRKSKTTKPKTDSKY